MIQTGLFPLAGLLVGLSLYALYVWLLRLKVGSRWAQSFIALSAVLTTFASVVQPVREVWVIDAKDTAVVSQSLSADPVSSVSSAPVYASVPAPVAGTDNHTVPAPLPDYDGRQLVDNAPFGLWQMVQSDASSLFGGVYVTGLVSVWLFFVFQLLWLLVMRRRYPLSRADGYNLYFTDAQPPFSFGRSVFLPSRLDAAVRHYVLLHELAHVSHHHFLKLCVMQLLVAFNWYNPFLWLLFGEMRLQQELEVDGDVLRSGVDREAYQLSLLRVCTQEGKWILLRSGFGLKPLKQRIIFMNKHMDKRDMQCRQLAAAVCFVAVAVVVGCHSREVVRHSFVERHHPMRGCWTMDWISNTGSGEEVHPVAMHYGFYNDTTFLCFSYFRKRGINLRFSISGEGYTWHGDSLLDAQGNLTDYTLLDERTALSRWLKDSTQNAGVSGPDITEQWSRISPNEDIVTVFRAAVAAAPSAQRPLDGVWVQLTPASADHRQGYCLVNDTVFMQLDWHSSTVARGFRYAGSGVSGSLSSLAPFIRQPDADRLELLNGRGSVERVYVRTPMPQCLLRAFAPAAEADMK